FFDALVHGTDGVADDDIAGSLFDDSKGLEDGDAAADKRSERAREAGDGDFAHDGADDGHFEPELVPGVPAEFGALENDEQNDEDRHDGQGHENVVFDGAANAEDEPSKGGQGCAFGHADKY